MNLPAHKLGTTESGQFLYRAAFAVVHLQPDSKSYKHTSTKEVLELAIRLYNQTKHHYSINHLGDEGTLLMDCCEAIHLALDLADDHRRSQNIARHYKDS